DWESVPDFCPSLSTLPNNSKCLKTEWKGQPMNIDNDPLINKLHPAEVVLASILRLPCNLYLDSKRRLFAEKVCRLKKGLLFRRTDAQKACRIDVNKASRLFAAYEKIGWLEDSNFKQYL
ncbi:SWIRM domain-containing protein ASCRUDRAFT_34499, partial [Ascoidea rubescens DSM 1968]